MLDIKLWSCTWTWWGEILVVMLTLLDTLGKSLIILYLQCSFWLFPMPCEGFWESNLSGIPAPQFHVTCPLCPTDIFMVSSLSRNCIILHQLLCHYGGCQSLGHQLQMCTTSSHPCDEQGLSPNSLAPLWVVGAAQHCLMPTLGLEWNRRNRSDPWSQERTGTVKDTAKCQSSGQLPMHRHGSWSTGEPSSLPEGMGQTGLLGPQWVTKCHRIERKKSAIITAKRFCLSSVEDYKSVWNKACSLLTDISNWTTSKRHCTVSQKNYTGSYV